MPSAIIIGGGLAGLSSGVALAGAGFNVTVLEARDYLGGRAASYPLPGSEGEVVDNCQHILLRCCTNLLDFYERAGVSSRIRFHREFYFIEPDGRVSALKRGSLPAPLHLATSFLHLRFLGWADKLSILRGFTALRREHDSREGLDNMTMLEWLEEKQQTPRAIERFWRQILVSAVNEELDVMGARAGLYLIWLSLQTSRDAYEMGIPDIPLAELHNSGDWDQMENLKIELQSRVERLQFEEGRVKGVLVGGKVRSSDYYICCLPFEKIAGVAPELDINWSQWTHSPITSVHLWFDRPVTELPYAALLEGTIQWFFSKLDGRYLQLVVSASRNLVRMHRNDVISLAVKELAGFLPRVNQAKIDKAHVIKEIHATFSARSGMEALRPGPVTSFENFFLAGDWTMTGWPATMEGAVRSGYLAAEAVTTTAGRAERFLAPDLA